MSYLGKEYKFVKDENFDAFVESLKLTGLPAESLTKYKDYTPITKLDKDGDTYTFTSITPEKTKTVSFKSGEGKEEEIKDGFKIYNLYTVEGNTVNQIIKRNKDDTNYLSLKRDYDGDKLTITITASFWDGTSYRYYSA